jgi:hypothetical protein
MSELHQTAKRARREASRFTLFCGLSFLPLVQRTGSCTEQAPEAQRYRVRPHS